MKEAQHMTVDTQPVDKKLIHKSLYIKPVFVLLRNGFHLLVNSEHSIGLYIVCVVKRCRCIAVGAAAKLL